MEPPLKVPGVFSHKVTVSGYRRSSKFIQSPAGSFEIFALGLPKTKRPGYYATGRFSNVPGEGGVGAKRRPLTVLLTFRPSVQGREVEGQAHADGEPPADEPNGPPSHATLPTRLNATNALHLWTPYAYPSCRVSGGGHVSPFQVDGPRVGIHHGETGTLYNRHKPFSICFCRLTILSKTFRIYYIKAVRSSMRTSPLITSRKYFVS
jgi:hypothetical protein